MLWFSLGTAGELIKVYPLLRMAGERGVPWRVVSTGQSAVNFWTQWDELLLPRERTVTLLATRRDLHTSTQALRWFARASLLGRGALRGIIRAQTGGDAPGPGDVWVAHGDTLSTLVGARAARALGVPLAHVEAGLRSPKLVQPFPEEINRRLVSRLAAFHFAQDEVATENLRRDRVAGRIVCTGGNTLYDAIRYVARDFAAGPARPPGAYAVANLHRFENLASAARWRILLDVLARAARARPVLLVLHPPTRDKLDRDPAARRKLEDAGVVLLPRQRFTTFIPLLAGADFVLSDGGSNQEECHYLGQPCLILRDSTERVEGLAGGSCVLSRFDARLIDEFLEAPARWRRPPIELPAAPSAVVLDTLAS
jgi:UDP-N-acetylglucosamine 2-epimerase (non-hydrolysing)